MLDVREACYIIVQAVCQLLWAGGGVTSMNRPLLTR